MQLVSKGEEPSHVKRQEKRRTASTNKLAGSKVNGVDGRNLKAMNNKVEQSLRAKSVERGSK